MSCFEEIRELLIQAIGSENREMDDPEILELIDDLVVSQGRRYLLTLREKEALRKELFYSVRKLDIIQELVDDPAVTEIMVNGCRDIFIEKGGVICRWNKTFSSEERLRDVIGQIFGKCNRTINEQMPIGDARLENGARVNAVLPPAAPDGPVLTIRRFPDVPITMEYLIRTGSISAEAADFLKQLVQAGYTILVGGGTSTGKTTFLNALSAFIPQDERVVTIEETAELQIAGPANLIRLECRNASAEGGCEITIRDLLRTALRMRPNRIIIGEIRGAEAFDFLTCLNTGHPGSLGSAHANSVRDMLGRLETMTMMGAPLPVPVIRRQIAAGIEILVHLARDRSGRRKTEEIAEITGIKNDEIQIRTLFCRDKSGNLRQTNDLFHREKLENMQADASAFSGNGDRRTGAVSDI